MTNGINVKVGMDTRDFQKGIEEVETSLEALKARLYARAEVDISPLKGVKNWIEWGKGFEDIWNKYNGYEKIELTPDVEVKPDKFDESLKKFAVGYRESLKRNSIFDDEEIEVKPAMNNEKIKAELTELQQFEKKLAGQIANTYDRELKHKLENVQKRIDIRKLNGEYSEKYILKSAEYSFDNLMFKAKNYAEELKKLKLDLKFGDNNYQKSLAELEEWYKEATRIAGTNWAERIQIEQLYKAKLEKLQQEPAKKVSDLINETADIEFERTHTAFEKQIRDIEKWRDAQLKKANTAKEVSAIIENSAEKESKAFSDEMDKIKGKVQTLQEKIFEQEHSEKANKAMKLQKEREELYNAGIYDPEDIERYYWNAARKEKLGELANIDFYKQVKANTNADMRRFGQAPQVPKQQNISAPDFKQLSQQFQDKLAAPIQVVSDSTKNLNISIGNVGGSFKSAANSAVILADSFQNVAKKLNSLNFNLPNDVNKIPTPTKNLPTANAPTKNLPQNLPAQQVTPVQQPKQTNDNMADKLKLTAQKFSGKDSAGDFTKNLAKEFGGITKQLADITKIAGNIAKEATEKNKSQPPQINVNPTINLNLNGSYILTQQMVNQLADDATEQIADAVTDVVTRATNNLRI